MLGKIHACTEEYMPDDWFKDKTNLYKMYNIKLYKTSKCLWLICTDMFVVT